MAFRFKRSDGTIEAGVQRVACAQIDAALAAMRGDALPRERVVHEVRRTCKALRGLIRLVRPAFPAYDRENDAFREIARSLARSRDGQVLADTLDMLVAEPDEAIDPHKAMLLRKRLAKAGSAAGPEEALAECEDKLVAARVRATGWVLTDDGWDLLSSGLARTCRRARRAMAALALSGDPADSHEWRKHVKYHWQHVRLLQAIAPGAMRKRARRADKLATLLGERHDLDLFIDALGARPRRNADQAMARLLTARAQQRAAKLDEKARKLGELLFDEKPRKLVARWGRQWRDWQGTHAPKTTVDA